MEVVNQSQIDFLSISDTLDLKETEYSTKKGSYNTDLPQNSTENPALDEEMREIRDSNISVKPPQSTRDSNTTQIPNNSNFEKSISGTKTDKSPAFPNVWHEDSSNKKEKEVNFNKKRKDDVNIQSLNVFQDSLPDPIHFIEKGFQAKKVNSTQRKGENEDISAFQLIQKIHNQLQQVQ